MNKKIAIILITFVVCFVVNLLRQNQVLTAIINALLLSLSMGLLVNIDEKRNSLLKYFSLVAFALIPLFQFSPQQFITRLFPFVVLLIWLIQDKLKYINQLFLTRIIFITGIILIFLGNLITGAMISVPLNFNTQQTIFTMPVVSNAIIKHQHDALYIPFRMRPLVYNNSVYVYFLFTRLMEFLSLKTLYDVLLLANLYPLFWGMYLGVKNLSSKSAFAFSGILVTLLVIGINKSPDKFNSFYIISPFFIYFILLGLEKVNNKLYLLLVALSLLIFTGLPI